MAALLAEIENGGIATPDWPPFRAPTLGVPDITVSRFYDLLKLLRERRPNPSLGEPGRVLDTGVEAQIHGPVILDRDVETLVADPAFAHTPIGQSLVELADKYGFDLQWHCGFRLAVRDVPDDFRGPAMPRIAERIAGRDGTLDAAVIGQGRCLVAPRPPAMERVGRLLRCPSASSDSSGTSWCTSAIGFED